MTHEQESRRGHEAERILQNEIFREAMDGILDAILHKWMDCPIADIQGQHELKLMHKIAKDFEANITRVMKSGQMADFEIASIRKRDELKAKVKRYA